MVGLLIRLGLMLHWGASDLLAIKLLLLHIFRLLWLQQMDPVLGGLTGTLLQTVQSLLTYIQSTGEGGGRLSNIRINQIQPIQLSQK